MRKIIRGPIGPRHTEKGLFPMGLRIALTSSGVSVEAT
jgi:hypothetical protein